MYNKKYLKKCMAVILSASMVMPTSIASMASEPATEVTTEAAIEEKETVQTEDATEATVETEAVETETEQAETLQTETVMEEDTEATVETAIVETEMEQTETAAVTTTATKKAAAPKIAEDESTVISDDWDDEYSVDYKMIYLDSDGSDLWSEEKIVLDGSSWTFDAYVPVREGYTFKGWGTEKGSSSVIYKAGDKITVTETDSSKYEKVVKLYAVWEKQGTTYKVTYYNADGSQELKTDSKVSTEESCSFSAYAGAEKKEGYEFIGWSTTPNATAIDYNTTKGPSLKATDPELKLYAVYVKTVKDEQVNINVYVEYLDESLNKGYEVDESSKKEVSVTCETTYAHKESGYVHQLKYKTIADSADVSSFKVKDGYEIVGMTKNEGANEVVFALDNTFMSSGMMKDGSFYLVARKAKQPETEPGTETEKQPGTETEKQPESETEKQPGTETEKQPGTETEKQPESETEKQPGTETEKQPESETEKQPETEKPAKPAQNKTSAVGMRLKGNASSTKVKLAWTKIKGADGYEIYGVNCRGSKKAPLLKTIKKGSAYVTTIKGLKKASSYRYYVKAYKMVNGKKTYLKQSNSIHIATAGGSNTNAKKVTVESSSITLKKGKTKNLNAKIVSVNSEKELLSHIAKLTYTSTDQKIATVTNKGTVKAKAKGTCYIYVSAANGRYKKVKITVK